MKKKAAQNRVVTFGEVMLRLSTPGNARFRQTKQFAVNFAGAEANVAVSLRLFGIPSCHITRFPDNELGRAAEAELKQYGVDTQFVQFGDDRLGLYYLENGSMQRSSKIIYDRFDSAFSRIQKGSMDWQQILDGATWFHYTGITPAISRGAADACIEAVEAARRLGITVSGDINYRRNLWNYGKSAMDVMPALVAMTDVVVAAESDIENCCGIAATRFEDASAELMKRFPAVRKVACTRRESVSSSHNRIHAVLWNGKALLQSRVYDLTHIVDRIGAGDAFMAGLIYGEHAGMGDAEALEFAAAACAFKHSVEGDVNLASVGEIADLVAGKNVGKLLR